jgi:hypothetical protein
MTEAEIREIIDRETRAWDNQNLDMLMSIFHQDMVWPWPELPILTTQWIGFLK